MPLNNSNLPMSPITQTENISNLNINGPLLVSSVLGNEDIQGLDSFINYDYQELSQLPSSPLLSNMEQGFAPFFSRSSRYKKNNKKIFYIDFNCKGKKIKKLTI